MLQTAIVHLQRVVNSKRPVLRVFTLHHSTQAFLKTVFPDITPHVKCAEREKMHLTRCIQIKIMPADLWCSHIWVFWSTCLACSYSPQENKITSNKGHQNMTQEAFFQLQGCFSQTRWDLFEHQDLETSTQTVLCYISFCVDAVTGETCDGFP